MDVRILCAGSAYVHGLQFVTGDFVVLMDADLSHHVRTHLACTMKHTLSHSNWMFVEILYLLGCRKTCSYTTVAFVVIISAFVFIFFCGLDTWIQKICF